MQPASTVDPLSEVLSLLKLRTYMAGGFGHTGDFSVKFPAHEGIKCYALLAGHCWLAVESVPEPLHLHAGDCFLLPRGLPFRLASDLALPPVDFSPQHAAQPDAAQPTTSDSLMVGGFFAFSGSHARALLAELPPVVHIRSESDKAELRWCLDRMRQELRQQRPGSSLVAQQLATTLLVQALRLHLSEGLSAAPGWLFALADPQMSKAIACMHGDPAHPWTLQQLAGHSGMSRSVFALRFKATVGTSPLQYLTRWRMLLAGQQLTASNQPVSAIAASLGYESESAFRNAFRRVMACSPHQYRRNPNP